MRGGGADLVVHVVQTRFINKNITKEPKSRPALYTLCPAAALCQR